MTASSVARINVSELTARLARTATGDHPIALLDVRESWERTIASLEPCLAIVMNDVPDCLDEIRAFQANRELIVYCHTGKRSLVIARYLAEQGFDRLASLDGGIDAWSEHNRATRHQY
ncbi:MAG: rhodanese-like domain-containing protein [Pseudomonadota bacterium]